MSENLYVAQVRWCRRCAETATWCQTDNFSVFRISAYCCHISCVHRTNHCL